MYKRQDLERDGRWSGEVWKVRNDGEEILCKLETNRVPDSTGQRRLYAVSYTHLDVYKRQR